MKFEFLIKNLSKKRKQELDESLKYVGYNEELICNWNKRDAQFSIKFESKDKRDRFVAWIAEYFRNEPNPIARKLYSAIPSIDSMLQIEYNNLTFDGKIGGEQAVSLKLYQDTNGEVWVNGIVTEPEFRNYGCATVLIQKCIEKFEQIYFGKLKIWQYRIEGRNMPKDERELWKDGRKLMQVLMEKGIIRADWYREQIP